MLEILDKLTLEHWLTIIGGVLFFMWAIAIFLFGRISVKYLEHEMAKEEIEPPAWDKGIGGRIMMYAIVIVTKKASRHSLIDDEAILRHTRQKDYHLAVFLITSSILIFTVIGVFYYLYAPDS